MMARVEVRQWLLLLRLVLFEPCNHYNKHIIIKFYKSTSKNNMQETRKMGVEEKRRGEE